MTSEPTPDTVAVSSPDSSSPAGSAPSIRPSDLYQIGAQYVTVASQVVPQTINVEFQDGVVRTITLHKPASLLFAAFPLDVTMEPGMYNIPPRKA